MHLFDLLALASEVEFLSLNRVGEVCEGSAKQGDLQSWNSSSSIEADSYLWSFLASFFFLGC